MLNLILFIMFKNNVYWIFVFFKSTIFFFKKKTIVKFFNKNYVFNATIKNKYCEKKIQITKFKKCNFVFQKKKFQKILFYFYYYF